MPIKVTCACGASFAAKDELAGKTVKCPKCQQPLTIAAPQAARSQARQPAAVSQPAHSVASLFDEAGIKQHQHAGGQICPSCFTPLKPGAILCIKCGFDMRVGQKLQTHSAAKGEGGHGEAAEQALQRAARNIEEEKVEEKKKTSEGLPWWAYLLMFCAACGFLAAMMLIPQRIAMTIAGGCVIGLAVLMSTYAQIMILIIAFKDSMTQGLLCFFIPIYSLVYVFMHWDECGGPFITGLIAIPVSAVGGVIVYFAWQEPADNSQVPLPPPHQVALVLQADDWLVARKYPWRAA